MKTTIIPLSFSLSLSLSPRILNEKSYIHWPSICIYFFFSYFIYSAYRANLEHCSLISPFSIIVPQLATKLFFNSTQSYNTCNSETHEKKLFNVKRKANETNPYNLNYKVIQLIIVLSLLLFQQCIQRSFVALSIVDWEYRKMYNGGS